MPLMSPLCVIPMGSVVLGIGYAIAVLIVIGAVCVGVVKLFGGRPGRTPHKRGTVGAADETFDPDDGTPHTRE